MQRISDEDGDWEAAESDLLHAAAGWTDNQRQDQGAMMVALFDLASRVTERDKQDRIVS